MQPCSRARRWRQCVLSLISREEKLHIMIYSEDALMSDGAWEEAVRRRFCNMVWAAVVLLL